MIGEDDRHYRDEAQIHIYGEGIINYGSMRLYGWYRNSQEITRLTKSIAPGDKTIVVERDLDIRKGEMIAVLTNTFDQSATERHTVLSYDKDSGKIVLNGTKIEKEHMGKQVSTAYAPHYVDMRSEVILLSQNVRIKNMNADKTKGCIIHTKETTDKKKAQVILQNVEIQGCSTQN